MDIEYNYFKDESEVLAEIKAAGYFPLTLDFPAESNDDHWHDFDSMVYILEGEITITEAETGGNLTGVKSTIVSKKQVAPNVVYGIFRG